MPITPPITQEEINRAIANKKTRQRKNPNRSAIDPTKLPGYRPLVSPDGQFIQPLPTPTKDEQKVMRGHKLSVGETYEIDPKAEMMFAHIKDIKQRMFLHAIASGPPNITRACKFAQCRTDQAYHWRYKQGDPVFLEAYRVAYQMGIEKCEEELWRRGVEGYTEPVYHHGRLIGTRQSYSDVLGIFMLKGAMPEKYRENTRMEHVGPGGGPIQNQHAVVITNLSDEELRARIERAQRVIAASKPEDTPAAIPSGEKDLP